jgi:hypothetical protein
MGWITFWAIFQKHICPYGHHAPETTMFVVQKCKYWHSHPIPSKSQNKKLLRSGPGGVAQWKSHPPLEQKNQVRIPPEYEVFMGAT